MTLARSAWVCAVLGLAISGPASTPAAGQPASSPEARLKALGIQLPAPPKPIASYVPAVRAGNLIFLAGQGPLVDGKPAVTGKVGAELTEQQGYQAARTTMLTSLAVLRAELGSLDRVRRIVKLVGWVNSAPGFTRQPWVINGASDLLVEIFGDAGKHARSSVGANELPLNIPVEIEIVVEVATEPSVPDAVRAAADGITADQLARDLTFLASDELLGRNTPSPGFDKAAEHIAARLKRAGVKPAGDDGTFFHRYVMRESQVDSAATVLEIGGKPFRFGDDLVLRSFAGPLSATLPVVYVGHGWMVPGRGIDPYAGVDVRGKIVLAHGPRALPKNVDIRQIGRLSVGASPPVVEAAARGAAALLYIPHGDALQGWAQTRGQNLVRRELEPSVPSAYAAPASTSILLSRGAADALLAGERVAAADLIARAEDRDYPPSFQLARQVTLRVPASSTTDHRPYNVVGMLEGSDPALRDEYITVEAHLDGAVGSRTVDGDAIYNSADDNASGSAAVLAIAERMGAARPRRSIIFIWDSGEERGLWGTRHFVHRPPVPLEKIVAHVNVDMIGANRAPGTADEREARVTGSDEVFLIGPGVLSPRADALLERVNRDYLGLKFNRAHDRADSEFFYPRTDAGPFLERGILTIGFTTGIHDRYHLPSDEARFLDPGKMERIARTVFASVWALADTPERPRIEVPLPELVPRYR